MEEKDNMKLRRVKRNKIAWPFDDRDFLFLKRISKNVYSIKKAETLVPGESHNMIKVKEDETGSTYERTSLFINVPGQPEYEFHFDSDGANPFKKLRKTMLCPENVYPAWVLGTCITLGAEEAYNKLREWELNAEKELTKKADEKWEWIHEERPMEDKKGAKHKGCLETNVRVGKTLYCPKTPNSSAKSGKKPEHIINGK